MILKNFTRLNLKEKKRILTWRNHKNVIKFMKTKKISIKTHLEFIKSLKNDKTKRYFVVFEKNLAIGVIDFIDINENSCEFGLYKNPNLKGVGKALLEKTINYAFKILKCKVLKACVFKENLKALNLYLKKGFKISSENNEFYFIRLENLT